MAWGQEKGADFHISALRTCQYEIFDFVPCSLPLKTLILLTFSCFLIRRRGMWAAFYMNRIRQYETHQSYPHRQIVSVHGRSPDLELHAYSACLPGFPVTLPRFVALTVE